MKVQISKEKLLELQAKKITMQEMSNILQCSLSTIKKRFKEYGIKSNLTHPWARGGTKFKSVPCEKVKEWLNQNKISFIDEFLVDSENRSFFIDIAFPDKMVGLEINGNQHYEKDGTLKPYYLEREQIIERAGWKLLQIHYSMCFNLNKIKEIISIAMSKKVEKIFDYKNYLEQRSLAAAENKKPKLCCDCHKVINKMSVRCKKCASKEVNKTKTNRCSKEELINLINNIPYEKIGEMFNVSGVAIKKWCKFYNINTPNRLGYWAKLQYGKTERQIIK